MLKIDFFFVQVWYKSFSLTLTLLGCLETRNSIILANFFLANKNAQSREKKWYWYFCYTVESEFIIKCVGCLFWKEHLGHEYWVETECRDPVLSHNLKIFERKNNFKLSQDLADFYRDCNGSSLKWGHENDSKLALGHFSVIKIENITEIDDGLFSLSNCSCCPPTAFDERYLEFS